MTNSGFLENQTRFYNELLESQEMSDVTLACDGYEVGVHKTIISASSEFFREIIRKSKHANPYIYLKGVSKETLETLIKFIYVGEATARTDNLENLVDAGNELKVLGIMEEPLNSQNGGSKKKEKKKKSSVDKNIQSVQPEQKDTDLSTINVADFVKIESCELEEVDEYKDESESDRLSTEINKRVSIHEDDSGNTIHKCKDCEKEFSNLRYLKLHIETHLDGFNHKCKYCNVVKSTKKNLWYHQNRYHKNMDKVTTNNKKQSKDDEDNKTVTYDIEPDMETVTEDRTGDVKVAKKVSNKQRKNVDLGELVDESNKERFVKELENLIADKGDNYECKVCQKEVGKGRGKAKMKLHAEIHLEGFSHKCKFCDTVKKTMRSIQLHEYEQHTRSGTDTTNEETPDV